MKKIIALKEMIDGLIDLEQPENVFFNHYKKGFQSQEIMKEYKENMQKYLDVMIHFFSYK
jgi:hypothetical protein